jgi:hypothetical protein
MLEERDGKVPRQLSRHDRVSPRLPSTSCATLGKSLMIQSSLGKEIEIDFPQMESGRRKEPKRGPCQASGVASEPGGDAAKTVIHSSSA